MYPETFDNGDDGGGGGGGGFETGTARLQTCFPN